MVLIDPSSPVYNTIIFYILIIIIFLILKPNFMYCQKSKRFKSFGLGEDQAIFCLPIMCIVCVIFLYIIFVTIQIISGYI